MRTVTCNCETSFEADLPDQIDLDHEPGRLDQILAGSFFQITCPNCGNTLKPELRVRLISAKAGIDLLVLPEMERLSFFLGEMEVPKGTELLIGYAELFERARIVVDGLDATAIEIVKYWLRLKAEENAPEAQEITVAYAGFQAAEAAKTGPRKLVFHISGIKEGEVAVLPVGEDYYGRILADKAKTLRAEPFVTMFKGPYRSIRMLESIAEGNAEGGAAE